MASATILAAGLACGAGMRLADCLAAYAAGRNLFRRERLAVGPDGLPPTLAQALPFNRPLAAADRLVALFRAATDDVFAGAAANRHDAAPFLVLLPNWAPGHVRAAIAAQAPPGWSDLRFVQGPDANALALAGHACRAIAGGRFPAVMVCAVDSQANADRLDQLMLNDELFGRANPYGVVPGEAAAVLLLTAASPLEALGRIRDVHAAIEPAGPPGSLRGRALGQCVRKLATALEQAPRAGRLLTDLSGPRARAEAFGVGMAAGGASVAVLAGTPEAPSLAIGDTGEAFGLVLACLALGRPPRASPDCDVAVLATAARPAAAIVERSPASAGGGVP